MSTWNLLAVVWPTSIRILGFRQEMKTKIWTHVETQQLSTIVVESGVVELCELSRDGVDVGHGEEFGER